MIISITIPAYKSKFLNEAIESVINQTYQDWELIVVDDCSPEDLFSIVKPYLEDGRVRYFRNDKNCGAVDVVDNWNISLSYCTGDFVICMGDDDRLLPCCLEEYKKLIEKYHNLDVYHAKTQIIDETGKIIDYQEERPEFETAEEMILHQWKDNRKQFLGDFLISRNWLNKNGGYVKFPLGYSSDWATANLAAKDKGIVNSQKILFEYRINNNSISRSQNLKIAVEACNDAYKWYSESLRDLLPNFYKQYFITSMTDMIYLDIKSSPVLSTFYWLTHHRKLRINSLKTLNVCLRGILASIRSWNKNT